MTGRPSCANADATSPGSDTANVAGTRKPQWRATSAESALSFARFMVCEWQASQTAHLGSASRKGEERTFEQGKNNIAGVPGKLIEHEGSELVGLSLSIWRDEGAMAVAREEADRDAVAVQRRHSNALLSERPDCDEAGPRLRVRHQHR